MNRFIRIYNEFGVVTLIRTCLLLIGLIVMAAIDYFALSSILVGLIVLTGLAAGFLLRYKIPNAIEYYTGAVPAGLIIYSVVGFLGDVLGLNHSLKLTIIAITTVVLFNIQFWSFSDLSVINTERNNH